MSIRNQPTGQNADERAYETLARRAREELAQIGDASRDSLVRAIDRAKQLTIEAGEFTAEQMERASDFLKRDFIALQASAGQGVEFIQRNLSPSRVGSAFLGLASDVITTAGELLVTLGDRIEEPIRFRTGEITGPGVLTCLSCDTELHFADSGTIPPCGNCHGTEFRKSY